MRQRPPGAMTPAVVRCRPWGVHAENICDENSDPFGKASAPVKYA
jgi:hypothetical protein